MSAYVCASSPTGSPTMTNNEAEWDSDGSLSWEDFFGTSTDLVPTLLGMYDSLIGRGGAVGGGGGGVAPGAGEGARARAAPPPPPRSPATHRLHPSSPRPLSISSIASSSSSASSSGASSCSGGGGRGGAGRGCGGGRGGVEASCAYLASIESLDDASDDDEDGAGRPRAPAGGSHGSGDSGRCSPGTRGSGGSGREALPFAQRVVAEVLDSERIYVRDLRQVVQGYLHYWRMQTDCPVDDQQLADLFSNIEEIYEFNSGFLERLEECGLDPVAVAKCFVQHTAGFCIYTHYCTHYPRTVGVLTELMRREAASRAFRERQGALAHALPLGSFLLKPVQRILKYHLLLQNMLKHMEEGAAGRVDVARALASMTDIAQRINSMKRRHEHAVRVQEIQSLLYGWEGEDLTTFGELCAEGAFRLAGAKALRHAFLFDRMLLITKQKAEGVLGYKAHILCSNLMLIESVPGEPLSFHVIPFDNPRLQYTLRARNLEQKREWALQLKRVILENYNAVIPSHARRLVMELGQHRTDDEILADKTPSRRQHSAPEYLEKRKQERERRKSEVGLRQRLRRARKSDSGLSAGEGSPTSQRRHRRASSSSRERSHSRDGLRSVSPAAIKERFGSWRRKSEPGVYSASTLSKSDTTPTLTLLPQVPQSPSSTPQPSIKLTAPNASSSPCNEEDTKLADDDSTTSSTHDPLSPTHEPLSSLPKDDNGSGKASDATGNGGQRSLEEIVGALLLQNRDFQKALWRQQRRQQARAYLQQRNGEASSAAGETSDTEAEADDGAYECLTLPQTFTPSPTCGLGSTSKQLEDQEEADYVTLTVPCGGSLRTRQQQRHSGDYDNLQQIWESVRAQQEEIRRLAEIEGLGEGEEDGDDGSRSLPYTRSAAQSLRRAQSFCAASSGPPPRANPSPAPAASLETLDGAPTAPAVWLRQQGAHLATPSKKSGSLPRSFQLAHSFSAAAAILAGSGRPFTIASDPPSEINFEDIERYMAQTPSHGSASSARGFPLASPGCGLGAGDTTEDESIPEAPTPAASMQDFNVHPQHKIYRPAAARASLRQVVVSVGARLTAGLRASSAEALDDTSSESPRASGSVGGDARRTSRRLMAALRHYSKARLRLKSFVSGEDVSTPEKAPAPAEVLSPAHQPHQPRSPPPPTPPPPPPPAPSESGTPSAHPLPIYKQGSSRLGARIALCTSDYADPRQVLSRLPPAQRPFDAPRPDSVLSASSAFTSSSDERPPMPLPPSDAAPPPSPPAKTTPPLADGDGDCDADGNGHREDAPLSDGSADSYYERTFEAIESLLENDVFRDSAVFSDHDDTLDIDPPITISKTSPRKVPPPVPAKPDTLKCRFIHVAVPTQADIKEKSRMLAETAALSVAARANFKVSEIRSSFRSTKSTHLLNSENRRHDDDWDSGSQHSASTVIEVQSSASVNVVSDDESTMQQKGWVKHVIGKLQGPPDGDGKNTGKIFSEVADTG